MANLYDPPKEDHENFLSMLDNDIKLTNDEMVYLNAAELGDVEIVKDCLALPNLNVNCMDYMGRNALLLAVGTENLELIDILLDHLNFFAIEDALLHVISQNRVTIVKLIIDHESYTSQEHMRTTKMERAQFSPDITPLILAAHYGNHEIIQLFLSRNSYIERPHGILCKCDSCDKEKEEDSLNFARSRLNKYRAFANPAYMALASADPVATTFHLRQELKVLAKYQIEFRKEYQVLMDNCMTFAYDILDSCRTSKEVNALLTDSHHPDMPGDPLGTLKKAVDNEEKAFVSHPNCQHQLSQLYYGQASNMLQYGTSAKKYIFLALLIPLLPFMCLAYIIFPDMECLQILKCPVIKFINHTVSNIVFLTLLAAATFGVEGEVPDSDDMTWEEKATVLYSYDFRVNTQLMLDVQILCLFWVLGHAVSEVNQLYSQGLKGYFESYYNYVDSLCISIYMASYALRLITQYNVNMVAQKYATPLSRAKEIIYNRTLYYDPVYSYEYIKIVKELFDEPDSYFLRGARIWWDPYDPQTVSDCLFAIANVMSFARVTYILPAFESLGPLQLSLGRMLGDITRFLALFVMIAVAFVVGMTNLYHYYRSYLTNWIKSQEELVMGTGIAGFKNLKHTMLTLYWSLFGMTEKDVVLVSDQTEKGVKSYLINDESRQVLETVGSLLFCVYCGLKIIILLNMLIAMMSQSFEEIQSDADQEWKFARTKLWLSYVDEGEVVPTPFNIIPSRETFRDIWRWCKCGARFRTSPFVDKLAAEMGDNLSTDTQDSHVELRKNLVRRYLFRLQRENEMKPTDTKEMIEEAEVSPAPSETNLGDSSSQAEHKRGGASAARRRLLLGRAQSGENEGDAPSAMSRLSKKKPTPIPSINPTPLPSPAPSPVPSQRTPTPPLTPSRIVPITLPRYSSRDPLEDPIFAPIAEEESSILTFPDDRSSIHSSEV